MRTVQELQDSFHSYLADNEFVKSPKGLYEPVNYIMNLGGKRLRPILALIGNNLFSNKTAQAMPVAYAVEIFHNFSLLHDDIMDEAPLRRGQPTVHKKYGQNSGILSGDVMLIYGYESLLKLENTSILPSIITTFNQMAIDVCEGQQYDMDFEERDDVRIEEYIKMIGLKTAALIAASLKMGAIVGGAGEKDAENLSAFGYNIGVAFQLQDDILDTYGDPEKFGKKVGGDIVQNKKTFLVLKTLEVANESSSQQLMQLMSTETTDETEKINVVTTIFNENNIREVSEQLMEKYLDKAFHHLNQVQVSEERKSILRKLSNDLMGRES